MSPHHSINNVHTVSLHKNSLTRKRRWKEKDKYNISARFIYCSRNKMNTQLLDLSKTYLGSGKHHHISEKRAAFSSLSDEV